VYSSLATAPQQRDDLLDGLGLELRIASRSAFANQ
jgi:hypothetical protein